VSIVLITHLTLISFIYVNNKFCSKSAVGPLKNSAGDIITDPNYCKSELLISGFSDSCAVDNNRCPLLARFVPPKSSCSSIVFTPDLVC
jgi:hypothetical protein